MKKYAVGAVGVIAAIYMLNFTFGVFELPDALPIIGNMDEAAAMLLLMSAMRYFGLDWANFFGKDETVQAKNTEYVETPVQILESRINRK